MHVQSQWQNPSVSACRPGRVSSCQQRHKNCARLDSLLLTNPLLLAYVPASSSPRPDPGAHSRPKHTDDAITYGSVIKLQHTESKYYLHSHQINWGSGSGQQSVTCT